MCRYEDKKYSDKSHRPVTFLKPQTNLHKGQVIHTKMGHIQEKTEGPSTKYTRGPPPEGEGLLLKKGKMYT